MGRPICRAASAACGPKEPEQDTQLQYALKLIRGEIPEPPARVKDAPATSDVPKTK